MRVAENPTLYHPFPDFDCSQDFATKDLKSRYRMQIGYIPQKDGSRLRTLYSRHMKESGIIEALKLVYGESVPVLREVEEKDFSFKLSDVNYFVVHTHTFLDSVRVIPIIANYRFNNFYNASKLFPKYHPEDGLGILLPSLYNVNELQVGVLGAPTRIVEYLASKRVCVGCGRVTDYSVPIPPLNWNKVPYKPTPRKPTGAKLGRPKKVLD